MILYSKAGKDSKAKFSKVVNNKLFSYVGSKDEGFLIEEFIYNALSRYSFSKKKFHALVKTEENYYLITYNDQTMTQTGEDTYVYSILDFSEEEISDFIGEIVHEDYPIIYVEYIGGEVSILSEEFDIDRTIKETDIPAEVLVSRSTKIKSFFKKYFVDFILIILIVAIPLSTINPLEEAIINERDKKIEKEKMEIKALELTKKRLVQEQEKASKRFAEVEKRDSKVFPDILNDKSRTGRSVNVRQVWGAE